MIGHVATCHQCDRRGRPAGGRCPCLESGRDILAHAAEGRCPLGKFDGPRRHSLAVIPAYIAHRYAVCRACPHLRPGDRCGVLADAGKGSWLGGSRGVPNAKARCPNNPPRWGPAE